MKSALENIVEYLKKAGLDETKACLLIAQLLEEEAEDYINVKNGNIDINEAEIEKIKDFVNNNFNKQKS